MDETAEDTGAPAAPIEETAATRTPVNPGDMQARRAEIIARVNKAVAARATTAPSEGNDPDPDEPPEEGDEEEVPPAPAAAAPDPRLADLQAQLTAAQEQIAALSKRPEADTLEGLLKRLEMDPGELFDLLEPKGIGIEKLSEAYLKRQDNPAHKETIEMRREIAAMKAEREAEKAELTRIKTEQTAAVDRVEGLKHVKTLVEADKARWPRLTRDARNVDEGIPHALAKAGSAAEAFAKKQGRQPTEKEARAILAEAFDDYEKDLADRATRYAVPDIGAAPAVRTPAARSGPPAVGSNKTGVAPPARLTRDQILAQVRRAQPKTS